jgi:hypothetical protein
MNRTQHHSKFLNTDQDWSTRTSTNRHNRQFHGPEALIAGA